MLYLAIELTTVGYMIRNIITLICRSEYPSFRSSLITGVNSLLCRRYTQSSAGTDCYRWAIS